MLSDEEIKLQKKIESFGTWMYKFNFTKNVSSKVHRNDITEAVETRKKMIFSKLDEIFEEKWNEIRCLDIACTDGHSSFELAKKNVSEVIGFDGKEKMMVGS